MNKKIKGIIQLFRPELPFAAGICVIVGEILAFGAIPAFRELSLGFLCGFFISGSALALNDYFDLEVDKVNAPNRPLPSSLVTKQEVIAITGIATIIGFTAAYIIGVSALILTVIFWLIGFLYNWKYKQYGLFGNMMVASSVAITFVLGGIVVGDPWNKLVWYFSLTAFLIDLGEEIAGDTMDMEGDKLRGSQSIPIVLGRNAALRISASIFFLVVLLGFLPIIFGWLETRYLLMIVVAGITIGICAVMLIKSQTPEEGRRIMRWIYLGPLFGLIAFIVGQFIY